MCYKYICCWCRGQRYKDYQETLAIVNKDMSRNLDVLDLLRRLKMHGFALSTELDRTSRKFISNRTVSQPLGEVKNFNPKDLWGKYEVMT